MSRHETDKNKPFISGEGLCIATTTGFNREPGYYPCGRAAILVTVERDDRDNIYNLIRPLVCPMRLEVSEEVDGAMSRYASRMCESEITIHRATVVGPEDDSVPGGCNYSEPAFDDIMIRTNQGLSQHHAPGYR